MRKSLPRNRCIMSISTDSSAWNEQANAICGENVSSAQRNIGFRRSLLQIRQVISVAANFYGVQVVVIINP